MIDFAKKHYVLLLVLAAVAFVCIFLTCKKCQQKKMLADKGVYKEQFNKTVVQTVQTDADNNGNSNS